MGTLEQIDAHQTQSSSSSSSSIDSSNHLSGTPLTSSSSSLCLSSLCRNSSSSNNRMDLSTDLRLGLSISPSSRSELAFNSTPRSISHIVLELPIFLNFSLILTNVCVEYVQAYMISYIKHVNVSFREQTLDWPPIKSILRCTLVEKQNHQSQRPSLFVKVYMEGIPIGRKLNLLAHHSYDGLVKALGHMFRTTILCKH